MDSGIRRRVLRVLQNVRRNCIENREQDSLSRQLPECAQPTGVPFRGSRVKSVMSDAMKVLRVIDEQCVNFHVLRTTMPVLDLHATPPFEAPLIE